MLDHLERIAVASYEPQRYICFVEHLDDMIEAFKDEKYKIELKKELENLPEINWDRYGKIIRSSTERQTMAKTRAKYKTVMKLLKRRGFTGSTKGIGFIL